MCPAAVKIVIYNSAKKMYNLICIYKRLLATMSSPLSLHVLHYGSRYFSGLKNKENIPNKSSVQLDFCRCTLAVEIHFKHVINNYLL